MNNLFFTLAFSNNILFLINLTYFISREVEGRILTASNILL